MSKKDALLGELAAAEGAKRSGNRTYADYHLQMARSYLEAVRLSRAERQQVAQRMKWISLFVSRK